jgi:predicted Zn-dependent peptidase
LYPQTPIAASIDDPMAASREVAFTQLKRFHGTWFVPNNVAIALIGDIDARAALAEIEQAFGDWDPAELPEHTDSSGTGPRERVEGTVVVDDPLARLWSIGWRVPPDRFDPAVVAVLTQVVEQSGFAVEQRFSLTAVRSRPSFARHIVFETLAADQAAIDSTSASEARGQGFERDVLAVIEAIARGDLPEREIVAAKLHFERVHHDVLADSDAALEQLAEAYVHGVEWAERVAFPKQIRDVTSDQVQQLARDLLAAGHVSIDSEVGQPKLPETAPLPTTALQASGRRSEFGRALAAEAVTEVQPEFLVEGRHYRVDTAPTQTVISAKVPGEVFHLRLEFPLTEDSPPLACLALTSAYFVSRDDSSLGRQFRQLGALIVEATCPVDVVRLELHGLDRNFEATLAWLAKFIEDAELSPFSVENSRRWVGGFAKQYSESRNILQWALGNHALGFTRRSLEDALQTEAIRSDRTTPGQVEATLRHFRTVAPTILYSGPRPESVAGEIAGTWTAAKHVEIPPLRAKALPHPRIFALQLGGPQPVYVTVAVPRPPLAVRDDLLVDVFNAYVDEALRSATRKNDAFLAFGGSYQKPWQSTDDGFVLFQGVAAHPGAIDEVVSEIRTLVTGPLDPELFEHAKQSVERSYRDDRVSPHDIPERVLEWLRRGHQIEPRLSGWGRLEGLTVDEFAAFVGNIAAAPFAVTFATDLSKLDMDELRTIAPVERVSKSALRM